MERNVNFAYIGGLFLLGIAAMIGFIIWMGGGSLNENKYTAYVVYSSEGISGVGVGTTVRYKGILVGRVTRVAFKDHSANSIQINLLIDSNLKLLNGACVSAESQGLAGANFLNIAQGNGAALVEGSELCYQKGFMGKLFENIDQSGGDVKEILADIRAIFANENNQGIQEMIKALKVILQNLEDTRKNIDALSITANKTLKNFNLSLQRGDYNVRQIIAPTIIGVENSLNEMNRFFYKANLLLERLEKSPYEAIFGQRKQGEER